MVEKKLFLYLNTDIVCLLILAFPQSGGGETQVAQMEQQLYTAVSSTSSWLDGVENNVFSGSVLLAENADTQLQKQEVRSPKSWNKQLCSQ